MKGYLKVTPYEHQGQEGITCEVKLEQVSFEDRMEILNAVVRGLQIAFPELLVFYGMYTQGMFNPPVDVSAKKGHQSAFETFADQFFKEGI